MSGGGRRDGVVAALRRGRDWRGRSWTPASVAGQQRLDRDKDFPTAWARTPAAVAVRSGIRQAVLKPLTYTVSAPDVTGLDQLDRLTGPVVFVANHSSHLDTPLILSSLPDRFARRLAVGAAADYFFQTPGRGALTALTLNGFPVHRYGPRRLLSLAPQLAMDGWNLLLFPEGTRSEDGWMNSLRLGVAHLCCGLAIPAVPIALRGSFAAMPRGASWVRKGRPRVSVRYGAPVLPEPDEKPRDFNQRLTTALARAWNEEDLGWYEAMRSDDATAVARTLGEPDAASWRRVWAQTETLPRREERRRWGS